MQKSLIRKEQYILATSMDRGNELAKMPSRKYDIKKSAFKKRVMQVTCVPPYFSDSLINFLNLLCFCLHRLECDLRFDYKPHVVSIKYVDQFVYLCISD